MLLFAFSRFELMKTILNCIISTLMVPILCINYLDLVEIYYRDLIILQIIDNSVCNKLFKIIYSLEKIIENNKDLLKEKIK